MKLGYLCKAKVIGFGLTGWLAKTGLDKASSFRTLKLFKLVKTGKFLFMSF